MKLLQFRTLWGLIDETDGKLARSPHHTLEGAVAALAKLGYDGIEIPCKLALHLGIDRVKAVLAEHSMKCTV